MVSWQRSAMFIMTFTTYWMITEQHFLLRRNCGTKFSLRVQMLRAICVVCCMTMLSHRISGFALKNIRLAPAITNHVSASRLSRMYATTISSSAGSDINTLPDNEIVARLKVKKILESDDTIVGKKVTVQGWVRTVRDQKKFSFIEINDGSTLTGIQAVAVAEIETYSEVEKFTTGAAVEVVGTIVASIGKGMQRLRYPSLLFDYSSSSVY